jgi:hypothetical protein
LGGGFWTILEDSLSFVWKWRTKFPSWNMTRIAKNLLPHALEIILWPRSHATCDFLPRNAHRSDRWFEQVFNLVYWYISLRLKHISKLGLIDKLSRRLYALPPVALWNSTLTFEILLVISLDIHLMIYLYNKFSLPRLYHI